MDNKNLLKGTMVYSFMQIATKMGSIILLPVITRLLTPEEYAIVGTLGSFITMFTVVLGLGIYNAQMKKYVELIDDQEEMGVYMFSSFIIFLAFNLGMVLFLFTPFSEKLFAMIVSKVPYNPFIITGAVIASINALNTLAVTLSRMKRMYVKVAFGSLISMFTNYVLAIFLIGNLKKGIVGFQMANFASSAVLMAYYFKDYFGKFKFKVRKEYMRFSLKNGIPLIFIELTDQIVNLSDRLVLEKYISLVTLGGYTLAADGGRAFSVLKGSFVDSWTPEFYEAIKKDRTNPRITASIENFIAIISFLCVICQLFAPEGITLIFPKGYLKAINYMPLILAGIVMQSLYCLDYFFHFHEDSIYITYFSVFAMIFNLGGNLIFIPMFPKYGPYIAAWTTILAFLIRGLMEIVVIRKKYGIFINYRKILFYFFIVLNPILLYISNDSITWAKFGFKIVYLLIVTKLLVNREVAKKIIGVVKKLERNILRK